MIMLQFQRVKAIPSSWKFKIQTALNVQFELNKRKRMDRLMDLNESTWAREQSNLLFKSSVYKQQPMRRKVVLSEGKHRENVFFKTGRSKESPQQDLQCRSRTKEHGWNMGVFKKNIYVYIRTHFNENNTVILEKDR